MRDKNYLFNSKSGKIKIKTSNPERKIAFFIFLLTLLGVAFFWAKKELGNLWRQFNQPQSIEINVAEKIPSSSAVNFLKPKPKNQEEVISQVQDLTANLRGKYAFYVYSLQDSKEYGINQDEVFDAASLNKIPIMLYFWQQLEKGKVSLSQEYKLKTEDIQDYGSGSMRYQPEGTTYTYRELLNLSGKQSDNTAAHVLANLLGQSKIQNFLNNLKMEKTLIEPNETTSKDIGQLLLLTYQGKILKSKKYQEEFFSDITNTAFEDRLPAGLPEGTRVAHKIGSGERAYHDCGFVFAKKPFVLCVLSKEAAEDEALDVIPKIASIVWDFEEK